jgi:hypothetical protein
MARASNKKLDIKPTREYEVFGFDDTGADVNIPIGAIVDFVTFSNEGMVYKGNYDAITKQPYLDSTNMVLAGSIVTNASTSVVGVLTLFTTKLVIGDSILVSGETREVSEIIDNLNLRVTVAFSNTTTDTSAERIRAAIVTEVGDVYSVKDAGTFYSKTIKDGDVLISKIVRAEKESDWIFITKEDASSIKTLYESNSNTNPYTDIDFAKLEFITVTQNVNLDTIESYTEANNNKISFDNASSSRLAGTSGTNTGDQDLTPYLKLDTVAYTEYIALSDETTALTVGTAKTTFRSIAAITISSFRISCATAPTGSVLTVDINVGGVSILSTKLTIDSGEKTSTTALNQAVITTANISNDAEITVDIDGVGSTVAGAGLKLIMYYTRQ